MGTNSGRAAPEGFASGESFADLPGNPQVQFNRVTQELHDDSLPGTYKVSYSARDERHILTLYTRDGELVSQIFVKYRGDGSEGYTARVYYIWDLPEITPAGQSVRKRLNLARFASALAAMPNLRNRTSPYSIY